MNGYLFEFAWDSIYAPDSGYVMCQANMVLTCDHVTGTEAGIYVEFRDSISVHLLDQEYMWCLPPSLPTDRYTTTVNIHRLFPVIPGWNLFHLIGSDFLEAGSQFYASKILMTMTYFPESYGTVMFEGITPAAQDQPKKMPLDDLLREELIQRSQRQNDERE